MAKKNVSKYNEKNHLIMVNVYRVLIDWKEQNKV